MSAAVMTTTTLSSLPPAHHACSNPGVESSQGIKRKASQLNGPGSPNRLSPPTYSKHVTDSPISPSHQRQRRKSELRIGCNEKRFLSLFDLAKCLNEAKDYEYPDR